MPKGKPNHKYTGEYKQQVVETMRKEGLSFRETAQRFGIGSQSHIARWERIYLEEGAQALYVERRGMGSAARGTIKGIPPGQSKKAGEDLIDELQRLRAENAYLKKLRALVMKEERLNKRRK